MQAALLVLAFLVAPWLLAEMIRRWTLADAARAPEGAWFRGMQWLGWATIALMAGLVVAVVGTPLGGAMYALVPAALSAWSLPLGVAVMIVVELASIVPMLLAQHAITAALRGTDDTARETVAAGLWPLAPVVVLLLAVTLGFSLHLQHHTAAGAAIGLAGFLALLPVQQLAARRRGLELQALTQGELRDRIVALAASAGVPVRSLYVVPMRRMRVANAFAVRRDVVVLSDWLVEHLDRRELDAVVAHELGHLKHHHTRWLTLAVVGGAAAGMAVTWHHAAWTYPAALATSLMVMRFVSRRFEPVADREAVAITGDPEALCTALVRISRLNHVPVRWGRAAEQVLTHPSTERRVRAIGVRAGFSPERIEALLAAPPPVTDPYVVPPGATLGAKLFSTAWKASTQHVLGVVMFAAVCFAPAFTLALGRLLAWPRLAATAAAFAAAFAAALGVIEMFAARSIARLRERLAQRLGAGEDARFVSIAPGPGPCVFEGFHDWDLGFLALDTDALVFTGEESRFRLPRAAIVNVAIVRSVPAWGPVPLVELAWFDAANDRRGVVRLRPAEGVFLSSQRRSSPALADAIDRWCAAGSAADATAVAPPRLEDVSGVSVRYAFRAGTLVGTQPVLGAIAWIASTALVLPWWPLAGAGWLETWLAALTALALLRVPVWVDGTLPREPKLAKPPKRAR